MKVLITGATSGLGKEMAKIFHAKGYQVIAVSRRIQKLEELKNELGENIKIESMDLSNSKNCFYLFNKYKDIDILINNAGFGIVEEFITSDLEKEINMINLNIKSLHILTKLFLKEMYKKDFGYILNVSSIAGVMPSGPYMSTYYATKSYVYSFTLAISKELKKKKSKVRVGILCPGHFKSEFDNVSGGKENKKCVSANKIAKYAINSMLKQKTKMIPGIFNKVLYFFNNIIPEEIFTDINYYVQKGKKIDKKCD